MTDDKFIVELLLGYAGIGADYAVINTASEDEPVAFFFSEEVAERYARFLNNHGR